MVFKYNMNITTAITYFFIRGPVEKSFNEFWEGPGKDLMEDFNLETWVISCEEWYKAWDGEFYMVGMEPKVTI